MKLTFALTITTLLLFSCGNKNIPATSAIPDGIYKGHFTRSSPLARYAPSNVTLTIKGNSFSGESDKVNYPAICNGTFKVNGNIVEFENECMWAADFDWSYILKDKFEFSWIEGKLEMTKTTGDNTDHYTLTLQ